jgi:hypothetical protein
MNMMPQRNIERVQVVQAPSGGKWYSNIEYLVPQNLSDRTAPRDEAASFQLAPESNTT